MQKGNIGVTTENIFPIIKKFLYSDHEIFLRELVSNAVDATQKLKTLASTGDFKGELGDLTIHVNANKEEGTITISDRGLGLTAEEIDKYINQIAFSGANDFLEKYKNDANAIIGHFGLGFYSAFMVAKKVEIITRSYKEDAQAVKWTCDGSPEFTLEDTERADRGTDIILHIDDDCKEFLEESRIQGLLTKYCRFLPVPVAFGKKKEWKDGKQVDTEEDNLINDTCPIWTKKPSELKDEDYKKFYRDLYPMSDEPLFWIHLNVDYPFNLTGVLYFPKIKSNIELQRNKIQLYCNQVYVTDSVEGIVPDFLTLLHGVIDSPDIPLNVSRSYLQSDSNVKKISTYITKKVADRLQSIFKNDRKEFEEKWDDLKIFINYGMLTQEDFYEKANKFALFKDTEGKYYTFEEYQTLIKDNQTDKDGNLIYLYANNTDEQYTYIDTAKNKGYNVLLLDGQLDVPMVNMLEQKMEKSRFTRVDADVIDRLIVKDEQKGEELPESKRQVLTTVFNGQLPKLQKTEFHIEAQPMGETSAPIIITQSEYMRRMKEMANIQPGMSFYGEMPDMFNMVLNSDHKLIKQVLSDAEAACSEQLVPVEGEIATLKLRENELHKAHEGKKDEDIPTVEKDELKDIDKKLEEKKQQKDGIINQYAADNKIVHQLIDLALLQNGMLKGEALTNFVKRSIELI
ncbi:molecular chaperone HtpG [uncultured Phocaeicola sp.]|uniref:molecular chaperone HtpG n=1 Tax=uncultured Phocaeicola sp. TaxID=990718 RepID=UPI0025EE9D8B|nr:molecular chaperone HtpG [uncultured Phocaeicola sp.]